MGAYIYSIIIAQKSFKEKRIAQSATIYYFFQYEFGHLSAKIILMIMKGIGIWKSASNR
jgi:hypothetical protein